MAEAQLDPSFADSFRTDFIARRRRALRTLLERGQSRGEVAVGADLDLLVDLGFGTIWYRLLTQQAPFDQCFADQLTDAILAVCGPPTPAGKREPD
jgi:hypothetical protein